MSTGSRQRTEADATRVRELLAAVRESSRAEGAAGPSSGRRLQHGTRVQELVADRFARIGLDADNVERELAAERPANERLLAELKADAVTQSGARAGNLGRLVDDYAADLGDLVATTGHTNTQYVALDSPLEIGTLDRINIESSTIEPYRSRAKVRLDVSRGYHYTILEGEYDVLHFTYAPWWNPHQDAYAVVTVRAILVLNGFCSAHSRGGIIFGARGGLQLIPTLRLLQTWTGSDVVPQGSQSVIALDIDARSEGFLSDDQTTFDVIFRGFFLSYEQLLVPPGQAVLIDVQLQFSSKVNDGAVSADFTTGEFSVQNPLVHLAFVTA